MVEREALVVVSDLGVEVVEGLGEPGEVVRSQIGGEVDVFCLVAELVALGLDGPSADYHEVHAAFGERGRDAL
ncbi:MAG: hypothetical protein OXG67_03610 [bacterium]|nr:hypothetical protein [bacterium]